jgi:2-polyprenyl-3-methyl-5-hydroxy-6-metoxy-1,4-benzoquinol methylase
MNMHPIYSLPDMPFCVGACANPVNPDPLPSTYPIELCINKDIGRLELSNNGTLDRLLKSAYSLGIEMGTPSDNTDLGKPYVMDFVAFIGEFKKHKGRALEIGAGVGFLSRTLLENGWDVDSIEPGIGYERHWKKHGVKVINEFFPSPLANGPYDLIVFYTVLEHIKDTRSFLITVAKHLAPKGRIILSVPDCSLEIETGDPSMLLHEHFQYFTPSTLKRTLLEAGFDAVISHSNFGRSIYACATLGESKVNFVIPEKELSAFYGYAEKVSLLRTRFQEQVANLLDHGTVGIYCPSRALALLSPLDEVRFFDDAAALHGKYYPPFQARIESRDELVRNPPAVLFIMTRTFGVKLFEKLKPLLPQTRILKVEDICHDH